jgi:DNA-binding LacI/PurR family transcriptional regulator
MFVKLSEDKSEVTISDVAQHAGVSTATVSRVIAGVGYVAAKTRIKVQKSITTLNFQPSSIAQSLRRQSTKMIGLILTDIQNPFYPEMVRGIEDEVQRRGYSLILCNSDNDPERENSYLDFLASQRAAGIIICADGVVERYRVKLLRQKSKIILVNIQKRDPELTTLVSQDFEGGEMAAAHLVQCGYPKIIYIANNSEKMSGSLRMDGIKKGASKGNLEIFYSDDTLEAGSQIVKEIIKKIKPPYGIVAHNDLTAIGALHELIELKIKVPQQVGIVGYDDIALSSYVSPTLTTINQNQFQMGAQAMVMLDEMIKGEKVTKKKTIKSELVVRKSTINIKKS